MSFFSSICFRTMSATPPCINTSNFSGSSARAVRISLMLVGLGSRPAWVVRILPSLRFMISLLCIVVHLTALSLPPAYPAHPMLRSAYGSSKDDRGRGKCQKLIHSTLGIVKEFCWRFSYDSRYHTLQDMQTWFWTNP